MPHFSVIANAELKPNLNKIFELWDEMRSYGVHECDEAARLCMERICSWTCAQEAIWIGLAQVLKKPALMGADRMGGWRVRAIHAMHSHTMADLFGNNSLKIESKGYDPGLPDMALAAEVGLFRAYTLQGGDLIDLCDLKKTGHYDLYYKNRGIHDRIWVAFPVTADAESIFCFDRIDNSHPFSSDELELAALALRGIKWFHQQLLLSHGLGRSDEPLTQGERRVILELLAGAPEREIACKLNLTPGTVHQYATRVYRKFRVFGRTEFMALWLSGCT